MPSPSTSLRHLRRLSACALAVLLILALAAPALAGAVAPAGQTSARQSSKDVRPGAKRARRAQRANRRSARRRAVRRSRVSRAAPRPARVFTCPDNTMPGDTSPAATRASVLCLINRERARAGLGALRENAQLDSAAQAHSADMVAGGYFEHTSPSGSTMVSRILAAGYMSMQQAWTVGENLAWGTGTVGAPQTTMVSWMNSPPHRANLLNGRFREVGIGVVAAVPFPNGQPGATYTTDFGLRR